MKQWDWVETVSFDRDEIIEKYYSFEDIKRISKKY